MLSTLLRLQTVPESGGVEGNGHSSLDPFISLHTGCPQSTSIKEKFCCETCISSVISDLNNAAPLPFAVLLFKFCIDYRGTENQRTGRSRTSNGDVSSSERFRGKLEIKMYLAPLPPLNVFMPVKA